MFGGTLKKKKREKRKEKKNPNIIFHFVCKLSVVK